MLTKANKKRRFLRKPWIWGAVGLVVVLVWLNNTNVFYPREQEYKLLAHRGLAQTFDVSQTDYSSNTDANHGRGVLRVSR